jgi:cytochrome d ubiquinol oxidase subunit II
LLPSTTVTPEDITVAKALAGSHGLHVGLIWWTFGTMLALMYFGIVYWLFKGKVSAYADTY